jgi:Carbamoyl-phosphate synthase L chain, ATP binding domain
MSLPEQETSRRIVFVCRQPAGESLRSAQALRKLDGVRLLGICEHPPDDGADVFAEVVCVDDAHDAVQLIDAARRLTEKHGSLNQIVTAQETLLGPVALAGEALGLHGMSASTVRRALDKSCLKPLLEQAGTMTARDQVITGNDDARRFADEVGFPIVLKPLNGSGGLATWCIRSAEQLELALELMRPSTENAALAEDYLHGQELCIDTITIANEPQFYSICCYHPSILEALENSQTQWCCVMPRDITGERYQDFIKQGLAATRALRVGNAMTHLEGFLLADGGVRFTDATLRPAGARIGPMLAFAYDIDPYFAWARVAVDGCFDGPWERKYAVGTIFLRGMGTGLVDHLDGFESVRQRVGDLLVEFRLPRIGAAKSDTYTGDGYVTVRHPETRVVEDALQLIAETVRITYSRPLSPGASETGSEQWSRRLQYFDRQLNKPAWDHNAG